MTANEVIARLDALLAQYATPASPDTPLMNAFLSLPVRQTMLTEFSRSAVIEQFRGSVLNGIIAVDVASRAVALLEQALPLLLGLPAGV